MEPLLAVRIEGPGGPGESVALCALLGTVAWATRASAGPAAAAVLGAVALAGFVFVGDLAIPIAIAVVSLLLMLRARVGFPVERPGWRAMSKQVVVLVSGYLAYELARLVSEGGLAEAQANSLHLLKFERAAGLYWEPTVQGWLLDSREWLEVISSVYSYWFLAFVLCALAWLLLTNRAAYRVYLIGLGASAAMTAVLIWAYPVAPPRMVAEAGLIDVKLMLGREHHYANELAAMPSLHVGWVALAGFALWHATPKWWTAVLAAIPGIAMLAAVVITGNHYWVDAAVGVALSLTPALAVVAWPRRAALARALAETRETLAHDVRAQTSLLLLTGLLTYLIAGQIVAPGFTDFWGYLVVQMAVTLGLLIAGSTVFREQGGLSWWTHGIAVATAYADTLGTDGNLYARIDEYDKLTHFFGVAAITAGAYDCFKGLYRRGARGWVAEERLLAAVTIGIVVGVGWETYEFVGDTVFDTSRIGGALDTTNDLIFDTLGALTAGYLLWRGERQERQDEAAAIESRRAIADAGEPRGGGT